MGPAMKAKVVPFLSAMLPARMGAYVGGSVEGCRGWERCACASQGLGEPLA